MKPNETISAPIKPETIKCPLCGFAFERNEMRCHGGCPIGRYCELICCPNCNYQFAAEPKWHSRLGHFLARWWRKCVEEGDVCTLEQIPSDCEAEVVALDLQRNPQIARLAVYGLAPGARIHVRQRWPEYVVRVGETELAMESSVASAIHVRRIETPAK